MGEGLMALVGIFLVVMGLIAFFVIASFGRTWIQAQSSGVPIGFFNLIGMALRRVNVKLIVNGMIALHKAGLPHIPRAFLEAHYLSGGNVPVLVQSLIVSHKAGIDVSPEAMAAHILAGGDGKTLVEATANRGDGAAKTEAD